MRMKRTVLLSAVLLAAGCSSWKPDSVENGGDLCVGADPFSGEAQAQLVADTAASWSWVAPSCLSSSCTRKAVGTCTVSVQGSVVIVTSSATWEEQFGVSVACTADCGLISAPCAFPPLSAGTYTLKHGARETSFTVPSTVARCPLKQ